MSFLRIPGRLVNRNAVIYALMVVALCALLHVFHSADVTRGLPPRAPRVYYAYDANKTSAADALAIKYRQTPLSQFDPENDSTLHWKTRASIELGKLVQRRLHYIQNPADCWSAKKFVCDLNYHAGYGSLLHHVVICQLAAYYHNRTLILDSSDWNYAKNGWETVFMPLSDTCTTTYGQDTVAYELADNIENARVVKIPHFTMFANQQDAHPYLPLAIPDDLADRIIRFHGDPPLWWVGQFVAYLTRPNREVQAHLEAKEDELRFRHPIVGIHIRRTDKINDEALLHPLEEYMSYVDRWYNKHERSYPGAQRIVYLASDDPSILYEAEIRFPDYLFISDVLSQTNADTNRYTSNALRDIVQETHFLSKCDYLVCTFSSNVCRMSYEQMQTMHGDASTWVKSLDYAVYHYLNIRKLVAKEAQTAEHDLIELQIGDQMTVQNSFTVVIPDGYVKVLHARTQQLGLVLLNKTQPIVTRVAMPTYPEVDES